jgi:regulator of protease activity HflC (stomatin/prohibitin superfamily)
MYRSNIGFGLFILTMFCGIIGLLIVFVFSTNPYTPAGYEGYVYEKPRIYGKGGFQGINIGPSNYGLSLMRNEVINIDIRPNTYTERFKILAKDDLNLVFDFHAIVAVRKGKVRSILEKFGGIEWYQRFVKEPFRTYIRQAVQNYASTDLKTKRPQIALSVHKNIEQYLKNTPFILINLVIGNIEYPKIVADAVEKKLAAQQLLAEKETQKQIAMKDAEIRVEEAKGIAQAQKIINSTLTANYLQHEAINAQLKMADSPNHTTVYIPAGTNGMPLVISGK